jgi:hypothetical protein
MKWRSGITVTLLSVVIAFCLFGQAVSSYYYSFHEFVAVLLSFQWILLACFAVWCGSFIFLTFSLNDLPLIALLLIAMAAYFIGYTESSRAADALILLAGVTLGKSAFVLLRRDEGGAAHFTRHSSLVTFLVGLITLLVFSSLWYLDMPGNFYHGSRWMGLWDNPNDYGMLMGAGVVLAIGLRAGMQKEECRMKNEGETLKSEKLKAEIFQQSGKQKAERRNLFLRFLRFLVANTAWILGIAVFMLGVGLVMSYSRGAMLATSVGLLYLAWSYGKLKWKYVVIGAGLGALGVLCLWGRTADDGPWYLKRLDFSRPSAQHRVSAWRGAVQMMWDHPLGVGWNLAVSVYAKNYSPPEGGAAALTMNSYLMLGTELGLPGLVCFVAYVGLCISNRELRISKNRPHLTLTLSPPSGSGEGMSLVTCHSSLPTVCRAGAVVLLVAFWFDGGLFNLPTAAVFWILLELGAEVRTSRCDVRTAQRTVPTNNECGALKS